MLFYSQQNPLKQSFYNFLMNTLFKVLVYLSMLNLTMYLCILDNNRKMSSFRVLWPHFFVWEFYDVFAIRFNHNPNSATDFTKHSPRRQMHELWTFFWQLSLCGKFHSCSKLERSVFDLCSHALFAFWQFI